MYIQKEIHNLRKFDISDAGILEKILDILDALNKVDSNLANSINTISSPEELKPCLLCKSRDVVYRDNEDYLYLGQNTRMIKCCNCGLSLEVNRIAMTKEQLFDKWNRRSNA